MLDIKKTADGGSLTLLLVGRLDTTTAPNLERELVASIDGVTELVWDMSDLEYISSAGLRVLLSAQKRMNRQGDMVVRNVSETVREVFDMTGFSDFLTIE